MKGKRILYLGLDPTRYPHRGELTHLPLIKTVPRAFDTVKKTFENLGEYTHVLFTSRTAASIYVEYTTLAGQSAQLNKKIYISIGRATAELLESRHLQASYIAEEESAEGVVSLLSQISLQNSHLFFPRSAQGRDLIPHFLEEKNIRHTLIDLYDTFPNPEPLPPLEHFDAIVFTSPSTVHAFFSCLNQSPPAQKKCIAIGPVTEKVLLEYLNEKLISFS